MGFGLALGIALVSASWTLIRFYAAYMTTTGTIYLTDLLTPLLVAVASVTATTTAWLSDESPRRAQLRYLVLLALVVLPLAMMALQFLHQTQAHRRQAPTHPPTPQEVAQHVYSLLGGTPSGPDRWTRYPAVRFRGTEGPVVWAQGTVESIEEYHHLRRDLAATLRIEVGAHTPKELRVFVAVIDPTMHPRLEHSWHWDTSLGDLWIPCLDAKEIPTFTSAADVPLEIPCAVKRPNHADSPTRPR